MLNLFVSFQVIALLLLVITFALMLYGDGAKEQKLMLVFLCNSMLQNASYILVLCAKSADTALVAYKFQIVGSIFVPIFYCIFIFFYCHQRRLDYGYIVVIVSDLIISLFALTCDSNTFFYKKIEFITEDSAIPYFRTELGVGYWIYLGICNFLPYALSLYALIKSLFRKGYYAEKKQYKLFILISLMPIIAYVDFARRHLEGYDFTPFTIAVSLSLVGIFIWNRRNYDYTRNAAETILNYMVDGVIFLNEKKGIVNYNPAASKIFTELGFVAYGDSIENLEDFPAFILEEGAEKEFELNGHWYEGHVRKVEGRSNAVQGYVIAILDMTENKRNMDEIKRITVQAEQANLAKSEFLANMSHEIRTPMNAIVGLSEIIMDESRGRRIYGYAYDIKSASQSLLTIINDILDLSKVEAGKMELIQVNYHIKRMVGDVVNMMEISASQRNLKMICEYDTSIPCQYRGDDGRIKQILINILNNAVKFTKEGYVKLIVGGELGTDYNTENLIFRIEDTGVGIKPENLEKIFEDFKQVDSKKNRNVEGTGLGLSITKRLVQLMHGTIEVESVYGQGTSFIVKIPQEIIDGRTIEEVPDVPNSTAEDEDEFVVENYKVLIVDDNLINRKVAMGFLKNYGFELSEAESGPQAIEMVKANMYNMIFMDHMMPGMDGVEAVRIIREECGENGSAPVIIALTANAMEGVREKFLNCGFQDFIPKPLDRKALNEILSKWISNVYQKATPVEQGNKDKDKKSITFNDIEIPGIDISEAMKHHTGEVEDYIELLKLYCMDGHRKCSFFVELLQNKDYNNYGIEVHGLKSASANVGAMELSAQAKEHEEAVKRNDIDFVDRHFEDLLHCYEKQIEDIEKYLDPKDSNNASNAGEKIISQDELLEKVKDALQKLEDFKSKECAHVIDELLKCQLSDETRSKINEIAGQLRMYEDDAAEGLLHNIILQLEGAEE